MTPERCDSAERHDQEEPQGHSDGGGWGTESTFEELHQLRSSSEHSADVDIEHALFSRAQAILQTVQDELTENAQPESNGDIFGRASILDAIDEALARWQAKITCAVRQTSTDQLSLYIDQARQLNESLLAREASLQEQQRRVEDRMAAALKMEARLERQRSSVATALRARKAEMLLQIEHATSPAGHMGGAGEARLITRLQEQLDQREAELEELREQLHRESAERPNRFDQRAAADAHADSSGSRAELQATVDLLTEEVARLEAICQGADHNTESSHAVDERVIQLESMLKERDEQIEQLKPLAMGLEEANRRLDDLVAEQVSASDSYGRSHDDEITQLKRDLEESHQALQLANERLLEQQQLSFANGADEQLDRLEATLLQTRVELEDLRAQNSDLASQLAKQHVDASSTKGRIDQESLTWEERKQLILQQLEIDDSGKALADDGESRTDIADVIRTTQSEIERRDREIEELRAIVQQQADTKQGVAIGAAAIANMLDSDELILEEREKIKAMQKEWEDKLRQSEIDISMERAKLARERAQLETQMSELQSKIAALPVADGSATGTRKRKWLEHLGLKDEI